MRLLLCEDNFFAKPLSRHFILFCLLLFLKPSFVEWKQVTLPNARVLQHRVDEADSRSKQLLATRYQFTILHLRIGEEELKTSSQFCVLWLEVWMMQIGAIDEQV